MTKDIDKIRDMHLTLQELQYKNLYALYIYKKKSINLKAVENANLWIEFAEKIMKYWAEYAKR